MLNDEIHITGGMEWGKWLDTVGRCTTTGHDWLKRGWITVININGKNYMTAEAIAEFWRRAKAGEFAKSIKPPKPPGKP